MSATALSSRPYTQSPSFVPRNASSRPASPMPTLPPPHPSLPSNPNVHSPAASSSSFVPRASPSSTPASASAGGIGGAGGSRSAAPSPLTSSVSNIPNASPSASGGGGSSMMRSQSSTTPRSASTPHFASRPSSPMPTFTPRLSAEGRGGSSLKHEVRSVASLPKIPKKSKPPIEEIEEGEVRELTKEEKEARRKAARALRKMLEDLPEPLPEFLPPTFLPTPAPTPSPPSTGTFKSYAISQASPASSSSSGGSKKRRLPPEDSPIGLGLGLSMESGKRSKTSMSPHRLLSKPLSPELPRTLSSSAIPNLRANTPSTSYSPRIRPVSPKSPKETKDHWSKDKWGSAGQAYTARATLLKRHGDAQCRAPKAHAEYLYLPEDPIRGLLCLTDAVLLYLYGNFCQEQQSGRVHTSPFSHSQQLRDLVRKQWERVVRGEYGAGSSPSEEDGEGRKEMATAMVGLMHMVEAVIQYHLSTDHLSYLQKRGKELAGPSPPSTIPPTGATPPTGPSPSSQSHSSSAESSLPADLLTTIASTASFSHSATNHLLTSRHHLSMRLLRKRFPKTYEFAIYSPLADEALPAPGDNLGAARHVDIDKPHDFVWPIELGMCAPLAHTSAFGRCLVQEMAEALGMDWKLVLE